MKNILAKVHQLQEKVKAIKKDSTNPYFNSAYFDINAVIEILKPILTELKLVLIQPLVLVNNKQCLQTQLFDIESGESFNSTCYLPENLDPQKIGSAVSYFRRYSLVTLLLLQGENDDDGNQVSKPVPKPVKNSNPNNEISPF